MERTKEQDDYFCDCGDEYIRDIILKYESLGNARQPEVVSREAIGKACDVWHEEAYASRDALIDAIYALQLPAPASSVQVPTVEEIAEVIAKGKRDYNVEHGFKALPMTTMGEHNPPFVAAANFIAGRLRDYILTSRQAVADGWIPVTERLPDVGQGVLVATEEAFYKVGIDEFVGAEPLPKVQWDYYGSAGVTHWQPLPEPPMTKVQGWEGV
jgi:hypothetical protein